MNNSIAFFIFGFVCAIRVNIFGEIYGGEVFALVAFPVLLLSRHLRKSDAWIFLTGVMFSGAQLMSDIYNQTALESLVKGVGAPLVFCVTIIVFLSIFRRRLSYAYVALSGVALAQCIQVTFWPNDLQQFEPWKWGYGQPALLAGLVWFSWRKPRNSILLLAAVILYAVISISNNARSLAGLPFLGFLSYIIWNSSRFSSFKVWLRGRASAVRLLAILFPAIILLNGGLGAIFTSDWIHEIVDPSVAEKFQQQAQSDVGVILAGRSEWLVSIEAFLDSPWLGHGSWAMDDGHYVTEYAMLRSKYGISDDKGQLAELSLIPAHSFLMGGLVWAGFIGGIFWLVYSYRLLMIYIKSAHQLPIYHHVGLVFFLWDVLFSPFGAQSRWGTALFIAIFISTYRVVSRACNRRI